MESCYLTFRSVTFAQRAEQAIRRAGISAALSRTPKWMEERGCGYCLRLRCRDAQSAALLLKENAMPFRKLYRVRDGAQAEEIAL